MKRFLSIFLVAMLLLSLLAGCNGTQADGTAETAAATETTAPTEATEAIDYTQYYGPWDYDVVQQAKTDGKLHYYFMSNEGIVMDADADVTRYKWGDSCLIAFPNGQTMLIDSGVYKYAPVLIANLQMMGVETLDYLVITHPHGDHQGGAFGNAKYTSKFLDVIEVKQVYYRYAKDGANEYINDMVKNTCAQRNIPAQIWEQGATLEIGEVKLRVLWPTVGTSETLVTGTSAVNDSSLVIRFDYGEHSSLFTGDLYESGELLSRTAMGNAEYYDVDLLKVPHHGHKTSSSDGFLNAVSPELAIATGSLNISDVIRDRYAEHEIPLMYNYINGYIHVAVGADGVMEADSTRNDTPDENVQEGAIGD